MINPIEDLVRIALTDLAEEVPHVEDQTPRALRLAKKRRTRMLVIGTATAAAAVLIGAPLALATSGEQRPGTPGTPGSLMPSQSHPGDLTPSQSHPGDLMPSQSHPGDLTPSQSHPGGPRPSRSWPGGEVPSASLSVAPSLSVPPK